MFENAIRYCSDSAGDTLLLDWPMAAQPTGLQVRSRAIAIRFSAPWLDAFGASDAERRIVFLSLIWAAIRGRMREVARGNQRSEEDKGGGSSFRISLRMA